MAQSITPNETPVVQQSMDVDPQYKPENVEPSIWNTNKKSDEKPDQDVAYHNTDDEQKDQEMTDDKPKDQSNTPIVEPADSEIKHNTSDSVDGSKVVFENPNISKALSRPVDQDEEMIDTSKHTPDTEMKDASESKAKVEEIKEPTAKNLHKASIDIPSIVEKSELEEMEKSEISESYGFIDPLLAKAFSFDQIKNLPHRTGRSESIGIPRYGSIMRHYELGDGFFREGQGVNYLKLEERGYIRHLVKEEKYDEVIEAILTNFPKAIEKDNRILEGINWLKFVKIIQSQDYDNAIKFGQENFDSLKDIKLPAYDENGNLVEVTKDDYFMLIGFVNPSESNKDYLFSDSQKDAIFEMINESIITKVLKGNSCSNLETKMKQLELTQQEIREHRNQYGEIFKFRVNQY